MRENQPHFRFPFSLRSRTPGPSPFSPTNMTPAFSSARRSCAFVSSDTEKRSSRSTRCERYLDDEDPREREADWEFFFHRTLARSLSRIVEGRAS
jgi:hypothetical protein